MSHWQPASHARVLVPLGPAGAATKPGLVRRRHGRALIAEPHSPEFCGQCEQGRCFGLVQRTAVGPFIPKRTAYRCLHSLSGVPDFVTCTPDKVSTPDPHGLAPWRHASMLMPRGGPRGGPPKGSVSAHMILRATSNSLEVSRIGVDSQLAHATGAQGPLRRWSAFCFLGRCRTVS